MKFLVLFPLLLSITLSQNTNDVYKRILKRINVTNAIEIVASNKTEMNNKINTANVSENIKDWVKNSSPNKTNSKSNIDLSYDKNEGGKAKGELYYFSLKENKYVFYYGTADVELGRAEKYYVKKCFLLICSRKLVVPVIKEDILKSFLNIEIRKAIREKLKKNK